MNSHSLPGQQKHRYNSKMIHEICVSEEQCDRVHKYKKTKKKSDGLHLSHKTKKGISAEKKKATADDQEPSGGGGGTTELTKALYSHAPVVWAYTHA